MLYDVSYKLYSKVDFRSITYNLRNFNIREYSTLVYNRILVDEGQDGGGEGEDGGDQDECETEEFLGGYRLQKNVSNEYGCGEILPGQNMQCPIELICARVWHLEEHCSVHPQQLTSIHQMHPSLMVHGEGWYGGSGERAVGFQHLRFLIIWMVVA